MALATRCPYCHTTFRVASDQLKLRGGIVRCGACQRIFDGNAHLVDLDAIAAARTAEAPAASSGAADAGVFDADAVSPFLVVASDAPAASGADAAIDPDIEPATVPAGEDDAQPVYTLDFGHTLDPLGILPVAGEADTAAGAGADDGAKQTHDMPPTPDAADAVSADIAADRPDARADEEATPPRPAADGPDAMPAPHQADPAPADAHTPRDDRPDAGIAPTRVDAYAHAEAPPSTAERRVDNDDDAASATPHDTAAPPSTTPSHDDTPATQDAGTDERATTPSPAEADASIPADDALPPSGRIEPNFDLPVDEELVARPLPDAGPDQDLDLNLDMGDDHDREAPPSDRPADATPQASAPVALPLRASADPDPAAPPLRVEPSLEAPKSARARSAEARARRSALTPTRIEAPRLRVPATTPVDEPEFVKRSRRRERAGGTVKALLALGAVALLLLLAAQLVLNFRNELAARQPGLRPILGAACIPLGCRIDWPAHAENLVIDEGDLAPIGQDAYALNTALHNQGGVTQAWPSIELELVDADRKPVLRRVFGPAEYLPPGTRPDAGFGARAELPVKLNFTLAGVHPASYNIVVFYP